jgi:hypothetical protein
MIKLLAWFMVCASTASAQTASVSFTLPSTEADTSRSGDRCHGFEPLRDLDSVFVWYAPRYQRPRIILRESVRGREGQRMAAPLPAVEHATVYVVTADTAGNRSCPSNYLGVNPPSVGVPHSPPALAEEWYDVAGRKLRERPSGPGVYFVRAGKARKVVVLR